MSSNIKKRRLDVIDVEERSNDVFEYMGRGQEVPKEVVSIKFHSSVVEIENNAFRDCSKLKKVVLNDGLREIGVYAFRNCISLQSISLPSTVINIGNLAFDHCRQLKEVVLNEGLQKIGTGAFQCCILLESIAFPSTLIDDSGIYAFNKCKSLREVVLNDGLKKIGQNAFNICTSLQSITIPSTVIEIGHRAFLNCCGLREVTIVNNEVQISVNTFQDCTSLERFKFPSLSTRLDTLIQAGQTDIEAKMDNIPAVEWRGGELIIPAVRQEIEREDDHADDAILGILLKVDKEKLDEIVTLIKHYETKEATTLFELALWKAKIEQTGGINLTDRGAYRIEVPGPVKEAIMKFLE